MAEPKTKKTTVNVEAFLNAIDSDQKRLDCLELLKIFTEATNQKPAMWGESIVGFGSYHYKSERSKQEGDWPLTGFSPRKQNITIYIMPGFSNYQKLMSKMGKYKTSVSCLYIKRLSDIDTNALKQLIKSSVKDMKLKYVAT